MAAKRDVSLPPGRCRQVSEFSKGGKLGEGTYGSVYAATDKASGARVALKRVKLSGESFEREGLPLTSLREISLLRRLRHRNIVALLDVVVGSRADAVFLVFEYCEYDLARSIDSMERPFHVSEVKWMMRELLQAVAYMHANLIMHRDLKMSNILLTADGTLKLCDFGLSRAALTADALRGGKDGDAYTPRVVTLWYRAPELLLGATRYGIAVDMWSVGCILGELLLHKPLLPASSELAQLKAICELLGTPSARIWPEVVALPLWGKMALPEQPYNDLPALFAKAKPGHDAIELLNALLTYDPSRRLTAAQANAHAWFAPATAPRPERPRSHERTARPATSRKRPAPGVEPPAAAATSEAAAHAAAAAVPAAALPPGRTSSLAPAPPATSTLTREVVRIPSPCGVEASGARLC